MTIAEQGPGHPGLQRAAVSDAESPNCTRHSATVAGEIGATSDAVRSANAAPSSLSASTKAIGTSVSRASTSCDASGHSTAPHVAQR